MSIFVGNLPFRAEREDVIQLFAPFGEVSNCSLPLERDTGRKRGFAFIEMADEAIESKAIDGLQGTELMGRPLRINKAEPRGSGGSRRGGRGGYGGNNGGYGGGNNGGYGGGGYGGGNNGGYGGGNNGSNSSNANKSSGAEGWEDRSYGNSSDNSEYENGRSRRKRGISNESNASNAVSYTHLTLPTKRIV